MGFIKWLLWTGCAVGLGVFLASYEVDGRTPLEHVQRAWKHNVNPSKLDRLKQGLDDAIEDAKDDLSSAKRPREHHSPEDRLKLKKLIAERSGQK